MSTLAAVAIALAAAWAIAAAITARSETQPNRHRLAAICVGLAATQGAAAAWAPLIPLAFAAWFIYAMAVPTGAFGSAPRRVLSVVVGVVAVGATVVRAAQSDTGHSAIYVGAAAGIAVAAAIATGLRSRSGGVDTRRALQWLAAGSVLAGGFMLVTVTVRLIVDTPHALLPWLAGSLVLLPVSQVAAITVRSPRIAGRALTEAIALAGVAILVAVVYLIVVAGINGAPKGHERSVLIASLAAAIAVAVLALPVRNRLIAIAGVIVGDRNRSTEEVATTFSARMSRAVPMDELLLQLVESLRATVPGTAAEVWTGSDGLLVRTVSLPDRGPERLRLAERERVVVGQARLGGHGWASVWLPSLVEDAASDLRVVPVAHLGDLLGLIVVRRPSEATPFSDADERSLVELARQLGLALHNVRLDSALQASLAELAERNEELQASRLRIVTAADASRRAIERNLHDGAQQHLVALAVKLGLAQQIAEDGGTEVVMGLLADLRGDVQVTIKELRELAHGIYPPLLRDRGLGEALRTAATRSPLPCTVEVDLPGRFAEEVETAAYFCCLEAMQNAGKYAGAGASIQVRVGCAHDQLTMELVDDGAGFDVESTALGHGFVNMRDRLGAIGGELFVESKPGVGTTVRAVLPARVR